MPGHTFDRIVVPDGFWDRDDTNDALRDRNVGQLFHLVRKYTGASQTRIGLACGGMAQAEVSNVMKRGGRRVTSIDVLERVADGLNLPDAARRQLGLAPQHEERPDETQPTAMSLREEFSPEAQLLQRLQSAAALDADLVRVLRDETENIRLLDRRCGAHTLTDKMNAHIAHVATSLHHTLPAGLREPLAVVLADASALAGWQAIDTRQLPQAWEHFERAKSAAAEAGDRSLQAFASGEQAYVLLDLDRPAEALQLIQQACDRHQRHIPARLRAWLKAATAEIAAACHDEVMCRRFLDEADSALPGDPADPDLPYLALNRTHLIRWRGNCLVQFGDGSVINDLQQALAGMDGTFARAEASLRCDLARALVARGDHDEARTHARRARQLADLTGSARQGRRIERIAAATA